MNRAITLSAFTILWTGLWTGCSTASIATHTGDDVTPTHPSETQKATKAKKTDGETPKGRFCPREAINIPMRERISDFQACYEHALKERPTLEGRVDAYFSVGKDGRASDVSTKGLPVVGACIAKVIKTIQFSWRYGCPGIKWPFVFKVQ